MQLYFIYLNYFIFLKLNEACIKTIYAMVIIFYYSFYKYYTDA